MANKERKLAAVRSKLQQVAEFLVDYLPLANAHNSDFFIHKHWDFLIDPEISKELLNLSDEQLAVLPSGEDFAEFVNERLPNETEEETEKDYSDRDKRKKTKHVEVGTVIQGQGIAPIILKPKKRLMICKFHRQKSRALKPKWDKCLRPQWKHKSLKEFVVAVQRHTLPQLAILEEVSDLMSDYTSEESVLGDKVTISNFMSRKKSYEVDVMADLCAVVSKHFCLNKVIDIGSGRGYLGCQLSLMHGLQVLGIDSSTTNTHSAKTRARRLEKHWEGLLRNAREDKERGFKVRRGKNYRGRLRKKSRTKSESDTEQDESKESIGTEGSDNELDVNLESIFKEKVDVVQPPSQPQTDGSSGGRPRSGNLDSLVIYMSEPKVRRPRGSSSDNRDEDSTLVPPSTSPCKDEDVFLGESKKRTTPSPSCQEKSPSGQPEQSALYVPITHYVTTDTDLLELVKFHFPASLLPNERLMLTGLHTCGNLAASILQLFVANPAPVQVLCNVGCCYHLLEEEFIRNPYLEDGEPDYEEVGFPLSSPLRHQLCQLGRNARMLASQAPDRAAKASKLPGESLFWRAVLQVILHEITGDTREDWQVGKIAQKCPHGFVQYVQKGLNKLKIEHQLTESAIGDFDSTHRADYRKVQAFVQLRAVLAPCIETLLLLDRFYYLLEQADIEDARLVQLFDPVKSPRCYAIIATKKASSPNFSPVHSSTC